MGETKIPRRMLSENNDITVFLAQTGSFLAQNKMLRVVNGLSPLFWHTFSSFLAHPDQKGGFVSFLTVPCRMLGQFCVRGRLIF